MVTSISFKKYCDTLVFLYCFDNDIHIAFDFQPLGADIYYDIYSTVQSWKDKDYAQVGNYLIDMVVKLQQVGCDDKACVIIQGILKGLSIFR